MSAPARAIITLIFLGGLAWLTFHDPLKSPVDGCQLAGHAEDCPPVYEFVAPDVRSEPRP